MLFWHQTNGIGTQIEFSICILGLYFGLLFASRLVWVRFLFPFSEDCLVVFTHFIPMSYCLYSILHLWSWNLPFKWQNKPRNSNSGLSVMPFLLDVDIHLRGASWEPLRWLGDFRVWISANKTQWIDDLDDELATGQSEIPAGAHPRQPGLPKAFPFADGDCSTAEWASKLQ